MLCATSRNNYAAMGRGELQAHMADKAISTVRKIAADNQIRMQGWRQDITLLAKGIFYACDYFKILNQSPANAARLQAFVKNGAFYHGTVPASHFNKLKDDISPTGIKPMCFLLKEGCSATEGLKRAQEGLSFLDCGTVCQISYYEALQDVLGAEKFNILFASNGPSPLVIGPDNTQNPLSCLVGSPPLSQAVVKGQWVYFKNISQYHTKHPFEEGGGYWTICCNDTQGERSYIGLGFSPDGTTHENIRQRLLADFNEKPLELDQIIPAQSATQFWDKEEPDEKIENELLKELQIARSDFNDENGGQITERIDWRMERVEQLVKASNQKARQLFTKWHQEVSLQMRLETGRM